MEFFKLNDLRPLINLNGRTAKFVCRNRSGFSPYVAEAYAQLIQVLKDRNFDVPGFDIEFTLNTAEGTVDVFTVENEQLNIRVVSDHQINIKGKEVSIFSDNSGSMDVYVLDNWERDKKSFVHGKKFHLRMDGKPRSCLHYDLRHDTFMNTTDSREYQAEQEPERYNRWEIERELAKALIEVVEHIKTFPVPAEKDVFVEPEPVYLTNELFKEKVLYGFPGRYGEEGGGLVPNTRLLSLDMKLPTRHKFKDQMHDGFVYLEIRDQDSAVPTQAEDTAGFNYSYDKPAKVFAVVPKKYNNFYVVDAAMFDKLKMEWFSRNKSETRLPDDVFYELRRKQAETMVDINKYKGGYDKPIVITNRRVWPNEVIENLHEIYSGRY